MHFFVTTLCSKGHLSDLFTLVCYARCSYLLQVLVIKDKAEVHLLPPGEPQFNNYKMMTKVFLILLAAVFCRAAGKKVQNCRPEKFTVS